MGNLPEHACLEHACLEHACLEHACLEHACLEHAVLIGGRKDPAQFFIGACSCFKHSLRTDLASLANKPVDTHGAALRGPLDLLMLVRSEAHIYRRPYREIIFEFLLFRHREYGCIVVPFLSITDMGRMSRDRAAWTAFVEAGQAAQAAVNVLCRPKAINFTVDCEPIPQGSMSGVCTTKADGTPVTVLKADNPRTHAYRNQVGYAALQARAAAGVYDIWAGPGVPVRVAMTFVFKKPKSVPASRTRPVVKPDYDKLARSTTDALTGVLWVDDAQVVDAEQHKIYGPLEQVVISVQLLEERVDDLERD